MVKKSLFCSEIHGKECLFNKWAASVTARVTSTYSLWLCISCLHAHHTHLCCVLLCVLPHGISSKGETAHSLVDPKSSSTLSPPHPSPYYNNSDCILSNYLTSDFDFHAKVNKYVHFPYNCATSQTFRKSFCVEINWMTCRGLWFTSSSSKNLMCHSIVWLVENRLFSTSIERRVINKRQHVQRVKCSIPPELVPVFVAITDLEYFYSTWMGFQ